MLQFHGKDIKAEFDLWKIKIQTNDFVRSLKFEGINSEKLVALAHRLIKRLVLNQTQAYITLDSYSPVTLNNVLRFGASHTLMFSI